MIALIGTDANVEDIAQSLEKSGLAMNIIYNALTDSDWYAFDKKLVKYLVDEGIVTLSILLKSLINSGVIWDVAVDIISSSTYTNYVVKFILAIFTGDVDIFSLIYAFLS